MTFPRRSRHHGWWLLLALTVAAELPAQVTTINVNSSVIQSPVKRFGINLGTPNFYDSGQMTKNLVFTTNPSFEGEIYQSTIQCGSGTANSCTDVNGYSGFTTNFWLGASYTMITGSSAGRSGTICSFSGANFPANGGVYTFCDSTGTTPASGDYMVVKTTLPANVGWPLGGDWLTTVGNGTFTAETNDLPPGTLGKQSGLLTAPAGSDSVSINMFFDSTATKSFVQLNGQYQLTFKAKGIAGNSIVGVSLTRGTTSYIGQTQPLTNAWATYTMPFTAAENGSALGRVELSFTAAGPDTVELDDVSLTKNGTDANNTTIFRDEVVQALQQAQPGVLRYWVDQLGESLDNLLTAPAGRQRSGYTPYAGFDGENITFVNGVPSIGTFQTQSVKVGLIDFLQLCQKVGADPWIVVPSTFSTSETYNLMDFLAGPSSTPYGTIRANAGQSAPWTSIFKVIHLEFGNEEWNGGTFKGGALETGSLSYSPYAQRASAIFSVIKSHYAYSQSQFDLIINGQSASPYSNYFTQQFITNNDSFAIAPYMMYNINEWQGPGGSISYDKLFGTTFAEAEAFVTPGASAEGVPSGYITSEQNPGTGPGKPIVTSEMNLGSTGTPPSGGDGPLTQTALNEYASSVGTGVAVLDCMFQQLRAGVLTQNLFALPGWDVATQTNTNAFLWGAVVDMGVTNLKRPQYLALQLANQAIGSNTQMLQTTQTGANPTDNQYNYGFNSVSLPTLHFIQSFAFGGSGTNSVVVFNVSPDYAESINFAGTNVPTGTVNVQQLWSTNPTDTNETSAVVVPTSSTVSNFNPSTSISLPPYSMTVFTWGNLAQTSQTITFGTIATQAVGTPLTLTATASSGLSVSYASSTASVCTVSGGIATFLSAGTCTITASQAGNSSYSAASPVTQSFSVGSGQTQTINFGTIATQTVGTPLTLTATASSGLPVSYSSATTSVCTVSGSAATFVTNGTCSLTASQAGNSTYSAATPVTQSFTVALKSQTLTFGTIGTQVVGTPLTLTATASSGLAPSYTSTTTAVCTVTGSMATFVAGGSCSITAAQPGNTTYAPATSVIQTFTVTGPQTITFGAIQSQVVGTPLALTATASSSLPVSYSSSTTPVCTVSGSTANFLTGGTCTITASQAGNSIYAAATPVSQSFTVLKAQTIAFGAIATQTVGTPLTLTATAGSGLAVSYTSSTAAVCTIAGSTATFVAGGTCSITASQAGNTTYAPATSVTQTFAVTGPQTITFGAIQPQVVGTPVTLTATASSGLPVSYSSSTATVCTVSTSTATFFTGGTCTITAAQAGNATFAPATPVSQSFSVLAAQTITFGTISSQAVGIPLTLTATSSSGLAVSYVASPPTVCTVSGSTAAFLASGTCTITASQPGNIAYAAATAITQSFSVGTPNAPYVGYVAFWGINNTGVTVSWSTDSPATTQLAYGTTTALGSTSPLQTSLTTSHGVVLTTLNPGTTYYFVAQSKGSNGVTGSSSVYSFTTTGTSATAPPAISSVTAGSLTSTTAVISWTTDQPSSSLVNYGTTTSYGLTSTLDSTMATTHSVTLTGLTPGAVYNFDVVSTNSANQSSTSGNSTFTTAGTSPAPVISSVVTSGLTSTSVTITWKTDEATTSQVNYGTTTSYGSSSTVNTALVTSHSVTLTGLIPGTTYDFDVVSANASNVSATSANSTFSTPTATGTAPNVGYVAFWGVNNTGVTVSWSTDVPATTQLAYGTTTALGSTSPLQTSLTASHGVVLTTLNPGTTYYFVAQSTGANGVTGSSSVYSFTTTGTSTTPPPAISSVTASSITSSIAIISWTTDEPSSSLVNYGGTTSYGLTTTLNSTLVTTHSVTLTGLTPGSVYNFDVVSTNGASQSSTSGNSTFTTAGTAPAPVISNVVSSGLTSSSVTITWNTDQATTSQVNYGATLSYGSSSTVNNTLVTSHSVTLTGLTPGTTYDFDVVSANASNVPATSANSIFSTPTATGTAPNVGYVAFYGITNTGVTISWSTDVPANAAVNYGTTTAMGTQSPLQTALTVSHGVALTGLNPGTTYYFEAQSTGSNALTGVSTQYSFTTTGSNLTISNLLVAPTTSNTATISWTTSAPANSYVQYGPSAGVYNRYSSETSLTTSPQCTLGYVPSGVIHYQLVSTDAYGNQVVSPDSTFSEP